MAALAIPCYALAQGKAQVFSGKDVKSQLAGTPHQLTIADGNVFGAIVAKVREGPWLSQLP